MEPSHLQSYNIDTFNIRYIELIKELLDSGHSVELPASGFSMFPTLRPGDRVLVKPPEKGKLPRRGSVVVCVENGITELQNNIIANERHAAMLVMHRLIEIKYDDSGMPLLITHGDSLVKPDDPWSFDRFIGIALSFKRGKKEYLVKDFIPGKYRYLLNRKLLWMFNKMKRAIRIFG